MRLGAGCAAIRQKKPAPASPWETPSPQGLGGGHVEADERWDGGQAVTGALAPVGG